MKTVVVIFGITGDLSTRKLLPALSSIERSGQVGDLAVLGVSRRDLDAPALITKVTGNASLASSSDSVTMNMAEIDDYVRLKKKLSSYGKDAQVLMYLSVPPGAAAQIVDLLGEAEVNSPNVKILFEKPFGFDYESAEDFISRTSRYFTEEQTYRIDHYLAKEMAAEIIRIRTEASDSDLSKQVKAVTIAATETIGIEGRAQFYEQTGALRDFIQGHLMQILALVLVRRPGKTSMASQRLKALEQISPADPLMAVRAQYKGYKDEVETPQTTVETFASVKLESSDSDWSGVELRLVTGKALHSKRSYIHFEYTDGTERVIDESDLVNGKANALDAYERVLIEAIKGNEDLFTSSPEVLQSWRILAPVQQAWSMEDAPLYEYNPGMTIPDIA